MALDASETAIAATSAAAFAAGLTLDCVQGPMTDLPFAAASFDHVLAWNVIYHGDETVVRRTLAEIARVTRPGGSFLATMLSARRLPVEQARARGARSAATPGSSTAPATRFTRITSAPRPTFCRCSGGSRS